MGSDLSDRNIYHEARNRIHARKVETEETTGGVNSLYQSLGVTLRSTRVDYVLCGNGFYCVEYQMEQVEVLLCPTRSRHPCGAPVYFNMSVRGSP